MLKSHINRWLLLLSIILQNIQFRSDFGKGTFFFIHPVFLFCNSSVVEEICIIEYTTNNKHNVLAFYIFIFLNFWQVTICIIEIKFQFRIIRIFIPT